MKGSGQPDTMKMKGDSARTDDPTGAKKRDSGDSQSKMGPGYGIEDGSVQAQTRSYSPDGMKGQAKESEGGKTPKHGRMV